VLGCSVDVQVRRSLDLARDDLAIDAGGFAVVLLDARAGELGGLHANFTLPETGVIQLVLSPGGIDGVDVVAGDLDPDRTAGRHPDGEGRFDPLVAPTPGAPNAERAAARIVEDPFVRGDANGDNRVVITDMQLILEILFQGAGMPLCQDRLDANDDGSISVTDATFIGDALFRDGEAIPPPYSERGSDPTADELVCPAVEPSA